MSQKTYDGKDITVGASGFNHYVTDTPEFPATNTPAPVLSPSDVMRSISKLEALVDHSLRHALLLLKQHSEDLGNPHDTKLSDFADSIADVLFKSYQESGGTGSKEFFLTSIFQTLHVASLPAMSAGTDETGLISVAGAANYIRKHNEDPDAHESLFRHLFPGKPFTYDPVFALYAEFGISYHICSQSDGWPSHIKNWVPYTYVGTDGYLHSCPSIEQLPVDYCLGYPMIPCFGLGENELISSNNFMAWTHTNVTILPDAEKSPMKDVTATAVFATRDSSKVEHKLSVINVFMEQLAQKTFSIFAKAEQARYLCITFMDTFAGDSQVRAIFDLKEGIAYILNHMCRYNCDMHKLADGWYRCGLRMSHILGQSSDIEVSFIKDTYNTADISFKGDEELLGYIWGAQLEPGYAMSPYMPSSGARSYRRPVFVCVPIDRELMPPKTSTVFCAFNDPGSMPGNFDLDRPILSMWDKDLNPSVTVDMKNDRSLLIKRYYTAENINSQTGESTPYTSVVEETAMTAIEDEYQHLSLSIDPNQGSRIAYGTGDPVVKPSRAAWNQEHYLLLGTDRTHYFNGYISHMLLYPQYLTNEEIEFLHGDVIYG